MGLYISSAAEAETNLLANLEKTYSKNQWKLAVLLILKEILLLFPKIFKFYRIFRENFGRNLEIPGMCISQGFTGGAHRS